MAVEVAPTTGSTIRLEAVITRDGEVWDLTGATVTLYLIDPSGNKSSHSATIDSATDGEVHYTTSTSDLDEEGEWGRQWRVQQSGSDNTSPVEKFWVAEGV